MNRTKPGFFCILCVCLAVTAFGASACSGGGNQSDVFFDAVDTVVPEDSHVDDIANGDILEDTVLTAENTEAACTDQISNDGDSYVDCDDYDCDCAKACGGTGCAADCVQGPENTEAACSDGCSNDGDSYVDCDDYDCVTTDYCSASQG